MFRKIIAGNDARKSRLHDEKGNFVGFDRISRNSPKSIVTGLGRKILDYRPQLPWISYDAINFFKSYLNKNKTVLEYGSGMSTIWYANHAAYVCSVEDCEQWYQKVNKALIENRRENIFYELRTGVEYTDFMKEFRKYFDMIMIDGSHRAACAANAVELVKRGGVIYLDNSDKHSSAYGGDTRLAEKILIQFAKDNGATIEYFTDFSPCEFFVQQGMLVKLSN